MPTSRVAKHWQNGCMHPVKAKNEAMEQWQLFLEKYASPTIIGKYPAARIRESEKTALLEAAANLRRDTAAVIPDSMMLELLEAKRTGNGEYHPLIAHCQRQHCQIDFRADNDHR